MKIKLSIAEFEKYQNKLSQSCFIYDTINQTHDIHKPIKTRLYFDRIKVLQNPNMIILEDSNSKNQMIFVQIKYVNIEESVIGMILEFVSGDIKGKNHDETHVIIAQK